MNDVYNDAEENWYNYLNGKTTLKNALKYLNKINLDFDIIEDEHSYKFIESIIIKSLDIDNKYLFNIVINMFNLLDKDDYDPCYEFLISDKFKQYKNIEKKSKLIEIYFSKIKNINHLFEIFLSYIDDNLKSDIDNLVNFIQKNCKNNIDLVIKKIILENNDYLEKNNEKHKLIYKMLADKLIPKNYKFDKMMLGLLFHLGDSLLLEQNNIINIDFLEYCYSDWTKDINLNKDYSLLAIIQENYSVNKVKYDKKYNKYIEVENSHIFNSNYKWIYKIEYFLEKKIKPSKKLFLYVCTFIKKIYYESFFDIEKYDLTQFVRFIANYGYKFELEDVINLFKNNSIITDIDDYDLKLTNDVFINGKFIKIKYSDKLLEESCLHNCTFGEINNIMETNKKLKLTNKCLENLCTSSNPIEIKYIIKKYKLNVTLKCVKNAIDKGYKSDFVYYLFNMAYRDCL
jgi:hypothetical protein